MTETEKPENTTKPKAILYRTSPAVHQVLSYTASNAPSVSSMNSLVDRAVSMYLNSGEGQSLIAEAKAADHRAESSVDEAIRKLAGG